MENNGCDFDFPYNCKLWEIVLIFKTNKTQYCKTGVKISNLSADRSKKSRKRKKMRFRLRINLLTLHIIVLFKYLKVIKRYPVNDPQPLYACSDTSVHRFLM